MKNLFGLSPSNLNLVKSILLKGFPKNTTGKIFVFGSRARGSEKDYSDLDLWIETNPKLGTSELGRIYSEFEESNLPIKVDLVTPENCLPEFRENILKERRLWFDF